jgi:hypothetical protein
MKMKEKMEMLAKENEKLQEIAMIFYSKFPFNEMVTDMLPDENSDKNFSENLEKLDMVRKISFSLPDEILAGNFRDIITEKWESYLAANEKKGKK